MVKRNKNYFSFYGILIATVSRKIDSINSSISILNSKCLFFISKLLNQKQLKPIKLYSTNNHTQENTK